MPCTVRCTLSPGRWSSLIVDSSTHLTLYRKEVPPRGGCAKSSSFRGDVYTWCTSVVLATTSSMGNTRNMDNDTKQVLLEYAYYSRVVIIILLYRSS